MSEEVFWYEKGVEAERERVASLPFSHEYVYVAGEGDIHFESTCITCENLALIKGENK